MSSALGRGTVIYSEDGSSSYSSKGRGRRREERHIHAEHAVALQQRGDSNMRFCGGCEWWVWLVTVMMMVLVTGVLVACLVAPSLVISVVDTNMMIPKPRAVIREELYESNRRYVDSEMELEYRNQEIAIKNKEQKAAATAAAGSATAASNYGGLVSQNMAAESCSTFFPGDCAERWSMAELAHYASLSRGVGLNSVFRGYTCAATCRPRDTYANEDMSLSYWQGVCVCTKAPILP